MRIWSDRAWSSLDSAAPVLVCALSVAASIPLYRLVLPASSDGLFHLYRAWELDRLWSAGVWLPRWAPDFYFGYGYPVFLYTPVLPYAVVDVFHGLGLGWTASFRAALALGLPLSGLGTYLLARSLVSPAAALIAGVAYALAPYHLVNLYQRGDLAEFLAAIWLPIILWAILRLGQSVTLRAFLALLAGTIGLVLTHNLSVLLFLPVAAGLWLGMATVLVVSAARSRALGACAGTRPLHFVVASVASVALGLGVTAFFWIPAFFERNQAQFSRLLHSYGYNAQFTRLENLVSFDLVQRYPPVFPFARGTGYQFGLWQAVAVVLGLAALPLLWPRLGASGRLLLAGAPAVCFVSLFMSTDMSRPLWPLLPLGGLIQFPWRFLALAALPAALLAAAAIEALPASIRWPGAVLAVAAIVVASTAALRPIDLRLPSDAFTPAGYARFEAGERLVGTSAAAEYLPVTVGERAEISPSTFALTTGQSAPQAEAVPMVPQRAWGLEKVYDTSVSAATRVTLDTLATPGLRVEVDRRAAQPTIEPRSGLAQVDLGAGRHVIVATLGETGLERAADVGSWAALGIVAFAVGSWAIARRPHFRVGSIPVAFACVAVTFAVPLGTGAHDDAGPLLGSAQLQGGVAITSASAGARPDGTVRAESPGLVQIVAGFAVPDSASGGISPFARLTASDGLTWAQVVGEPLASGPSERIRLALPVPAGTPPGAYRLEVGAARTGTGLSRPTELPLIGLAATPLLPLGSSAPLATVVIAASSTFPSATGLAAFDRAVDLGTPAVAVRRGGSAELAYPATSAPDCAPGVVSSGALCLVAGDLLEVRLPWRDRGIAGHTMTVTLQLVDDAGKQWASADAEPASGRFPATFWRAGSEVLDAMALPIPSYVPPGDYKLIVAVARDGQRVGASDLTGRAAGSEAMLASVRLRPADRDVAFVTVTPPVPDQPYQDAGLGLTLRGSAIGPPRIRDGELLDVRALWSAQASSRQDIDMSVTLVGTDRAQHELTDAPPATNYPTSRWLPGVPVLTLWSLRLPSSLAPGSYAVMTTLHNGDASGPRLKLGDVTVLPAPPIPDVRPEQAVDAAFGDQLDLFGVDPALPARTPAASPLGVTLYWRGMRPMTTNYSVSLQVLDSSGKLAAQADAPPGDQGAGTSLWRPGAPVIDRRPLDLSKLTPGAYTAQVVVYNPATGERLRLPDGADAFPLGRVSIGL